MMLGSQMSVFAAPRCCAGAGVQPIPFRDRLQRSRWSLCLALPSFAHYSGIEEGSPAPARALTLYTQAHGFVLVLIHFEDQ